MPQPDRVADRGASIRTVQQRFEEHGGDETFFRRAAAAFKLKPRTWFSARAYIPASGPLLVVANHPYGVVVDGLTISALLEHVRPDMRIIVWNFIDHFDDLFRRSLFLIETKRMIGAHIACRTANPYCQQNWPK